MGLIIVIVLVVLLLGGGAATTGIPNGAHAGALGSLGRFS